MDHRAVVRAMASGRIIIGSALVAAPGRSGGSWIGEAAEAAEVKVMIRAMGVRDLAIGLGTARALRTGEAVRPWVLLSALCDGVDLAATVLAVRRIGLRRALPVMAVAGGAAALGLAAADEVDA